MSNKVNLVTAGTVVKIGADIEFMASKISGDYLFPSLVNDGDSIEALYKGIANVGCDEFGHCVEIRPAPATNREEFVTNMMTAMAELPAGPSYSAPNAIRIDKKDFFKLMRKQGGKSIPECKNIYGTDILNDGKEDLEARKAGKRLLFCGAHIHVSVKKKINLNASTTNPTINETHYVDETIPVETLVYLLDNILFPCFKNDPDFNIGRYRAPGFYEAQKYHGGFEYRSLGASVFTPQRMAWIFDVVEYIVKHHDYLSKLFLTKKKKVKLPEKLDSLTTSLKHRGPESGDLRRLWVPWLP